MSQNSQWSQAGQFVQPACLAHLAMLAAGLAQDKRKKL